MLLLLQMGPPFAATCSQVPRSYPEAHIASRTNDTAAVKAPLLHLEHERPHPETRVRKSVFCPVDRPTPRQTTVSHMSVADAGYPKDARHESTTLVLCC